MAAGLLLAGWAYSRASSASRSDRLRTFGARRAAANEKLAACIIRYKAETKRAAGQAQILGVAAGIVVGMASGDYKAAVKAMKDTKAFYAKVRGEIPGCAAEASDAEAEWNALAAEAESLGIPLDISDDELGRMALSADGGMQGWKQLEAKKRANVYWLCRQKGGLTDANCINPSGDPLYRCIRNPETNKNECGYATNEWFRGESTELSPTKPGQVFTPVRTSTKG
jgi:hypothetical protein